jgi:hypothetical protein
MGLLELLRSLFGKNYLNKVIGTGTNVSKPIKLDKNSPFKLYSDKAFNDPEVLAFIEKKLAEYGPYALSNKNMSEVKNFEMNARRLLNAKQPKKESTVKSAVESMFGPLGKSDKPTPKPEAEVVDIRTKEKVKPEGIMKLKTELGLPEGVEPGSIADKAIKESVEYKTKQQGVDSVLDEDYVPPKSTLLDEDEIADIGARGYSAAVEGKRRAVIRQILLKDARIDLPEDVRNSLKNYDDLRGGGDQNMDPLKVFENYYERDNEVLGTLDGIIDTAQNEFKAADEFLAAKDNFKVKKPVVRESLDDEAVEMEETKDLGERLEDLPDDIDPDALAEGGRPGFAGGGIKFLKEMINKKFGKDTMKTADEVKVTDEMLFEKDKRRLLEELQDYKDVAPKFYQRMELKIKYPGISDELIAKIMADDDPQRVAEVMATMDEAFKMMDKGMSSDEILKTFKTTPRTKNAGGGLNYLMGL